MTTAQLNEWLSQPGEVCACTACHQSVKVFARGGGIWWLDVTMGNACPDADMAPHRGGEVSRLELARVSTCRHCDRRIVLDVIDGWVDPEATGDDVTWREGCDEHDTFEMRHEPLEELEELER
jgi:hypothetical protein